MTLSRRRVLQGLGGTAVAGLAGCPSSERPPAPELSWVGQSPERGHVIRDGARRAGPVAETIKTRVAIVGGGVSGVAAAWRLRRAGVHDVRLLELEDALGGTARGGQTSRSRYPLGAHYLPSPHPRFDWLVTLLDELGFVHGHYEGRPEFDPSIVCRAPVERYFHRGSWHEGIYPADGQTPDEEAQWERWNAHLLALDGKTGEDGLPLFTLPVRRSSQSLRHLDGISIATYLDRLGLDSWRLRWTVDYACRDDYGCSLEQTSAFAGLHHYLARGLEDRHDRVTLRWPEGNEHLVRSIAALANLEDRVHAPVAAVSIDPDRGRIIAYDEAADRHLAFEADMVLWAAPRFVLSRVLPAGVDPLPRGALTYAPWLVANVQVSRAPGGLGAPLAWDNVPVGHPNLGYVVANHGDTLAEQLDPRAVLTYYEPFVATKDEALDAARTRMLKTKLPQWGSHVTASLEKMHPGIATTIERIDVARWGHAMIRPTPGLLFGDALAQARAPIGRVLPCATDTGGLPLFEEAFAGGVLAAEEAMARIGVDQATFIATDRLG
jgi:glycine/D-amino acid oxidase-like deaminating enzyme